ncbi:CD99 antigen-like protein 2 isoform X1 [Eschrichtius robustus]|uniref:CD99 antigen-like protein 2 isoform X1 n=1 Tax=Eschrichtius robustus TaxID=9764 RepID=UPI0035BF5639
MVAWHSAFLICLAFSLATVVQRGSGDVGFSLEDALEETSSVKQRWDHVTTTTRRPGATRAPAKPAGSKFDLADALDDQDHGHRKPSAGGGERWDHVTTTTRRPGATRAPAKPAGPPEEKEFDLADALDDRNDQDHGHRKPNAGGGGFSDKDLEDLLGGGEYKPDKGKGDTRCTGPTRCYPSESGSPGVGSAPPPAGRSPACAPLLPALLLGMVAGRTCAGGLRVKSQDVTRSQCTVAVISKIKRPTWALAGDRLKEAGLATVRAEPTGAVLAGPGAEVDPEGLSQSGRGCPSRPRAGGHGGH